MKSAQTTREALVAEMLGDLDGLLSRVEQLLAALNYSEKKTVSTIKALDDAGGRITLEWVAEWRGIRNREKPTQTALSAH